MEIWVLGSEHLNADKSILWNEPFPHFANCDYLIVNLQTLNEKLLSNDSTKFFDIGRKYIFDFLMTGQKTAIFVLSANQERLKWLPIYPNLKNTEPVNIKESFVDLSYLQEYIQNINNCNFYIHSFDHTYLDNKINPKSQGHEIYEFTDRIIERSGKVAFDTITERAMINQANQLVGGYFHCSVGHSFKILSSWHRALLHYVRTLVFLPPPTEITVEKGIDLIINSLLGKELKESPPKWEEEIDLPDLANIENEIVQKEIEKKKIIGAIDELIKKKKQVTMFRKLVWTKGTPLEEIVRDAFVFLGFPEIRKIRSKDLEDWVFDFQTISDYKYGVIEVKGSDKRTSLADLTQCNKWVEDYMLEKRGVAKGILIPNQHRLADIRESINIREHFEPNELDYAYKREICILPTHQIFSAVVEKMKNNLQINRKTIEQKIASSRDVCKLI